MSGPISAETRAKIGASGKAYWASLRPIDRLARLGHAKARGFNGSHGRSRGDPAKLSVAGKRNWEDQGYRALVAGRQAALWAAWWATPIGRLVFELRRKERQLKKRRRHYPPGFTNKLKLRIRQRDGFRCQECGAQEAGIPWQVHHINYNKADNRPENLILLCNRCHGRTNRGDPAAWEEHFAGMVLKTARIAYSPRKVEELST